MQTPLRQKNQNLGVQHGIRKKAKQPALVHLTLYQPLVPTVTTLFETRHVMVAVMLIESAPQQDIPHLFIEPKIRIVLRHVVTIASAMTCGQIQATLRHGQTKIAVLHRKFHHGF